MRKPTRPDDTPRAGRVRCLGPCREHLFWSPDRSRYRVCEAGRIRQEAVPIARWTGTDVRRSRVVRSPAE